MTTDVRLDARPLVNRIVELLREQILTGELSPGRKISQDDVAQNLGVSRTPIREAFQILASEGWVVTRPRAGVEVAKLSTDEVQDIAVMRLLIEPYAAKLAAETHDTAREAKAHLLAGRVAPSHSDRSWFDQVEDVNREFHFLIYGMGEGILPDLLEASITHHWERFARYRRIHWAAESQIRKSQEMHEQILDAWIARDGEATRKAVAEHIIPVAVELVHRIDPEAPLKLSLTRIAADFGVPIE